MEAVVSRMKTVQVSINDTEVSKSGVPNKSPTMRFVAVSATIPNVNDIAAWLDTGISSYSVIVTFSKIFYFLGAKK